MEHTQRTPTGHLRLSTHDLAVAGIFGALAVVLAFTPLGLIPVPNPTEAAICPPSSPASSPGPSSAA